MDTLQVSAPSPRWLQMGWGLEIHRRPTGPELTLRLAYSIAQSPRAALHWVALRLTVDAGKSWLNDAVVPRWRLLPALFRSALWSLLVNKHLAVLADKNTQFASRRSDRLGVNVSKTKGVFINGFKPGWFVEGGSHLPNSFYFNVQWNIRNMRFFFLISKHRIYYAEYFAEIQCHRIIKLNVNFICGQFRATLNVSRHAANCMMNSFC